MAYREDKDLEFLREVKSEDLENLVYCLTKDTDGESRWTEELTSSEKYKKYHPEHSKYWQEIAAEIQCFGANTFATIFRGGKGVLYEEVLRDVADHLKVPHDESNKVGEIEEKIIISLFSKSIEKMTPDELKQISKEFSLSDLSSYSGEALLAAVQMIFQAGGVQSYKLTWLVVNAVTRSIFGHGIKIAASATIARTVSIMTGPIGWAITGLWTAWDVAGPATRVTMPAVLQVAFLRRKYEMEKLGLIDEILKKSGYAYF